MARRLVALVGGAGQPGQQAQGEHGAGDDDAGVGHDGREGVGQRHPQGPTPGGRPRNTSGSSRVAAKAVSARATAASVTVSNSARSASGSRRARARFLPATRAKRASLGATARRDAAGERREHPFLAQVEQDPARAGVDRLQQAGQHAAAEGVAQRTVDPDPQPLTGGADPGVRPGVERRTEHPGAAGHDAPDGVGAEGGDRGEHPLDGAEGQVDRVGGRTVGDGEERGDRPGLEQRHLAAGDRPLDVLRRAVLRLDPPAEVDERAHVVVGEGGLGPAVAVPGLDTAAGERRRRDGLGAEGPGEEPTGGRVRDVVVRFDEARDEGLAQPERRVDGHLPAVPREWVRREEHAGGVGGHHPLDGDREGGGLLGDAGPASVRDGPRGPEARPASTTAARRAASSVTPSRVSCWPANDRSGRSSAVADDRTATGPPPIRRYASSTAWATGSVRRVGRAPRRTRRGCGPRRRRRSPGRRGRRRRGHRPPGRAARARGRPCGRRRS